MGDEFLGDGGGWDDKPVLGPNVTDRETVLELSKMTYNAYYQGSDDKGWYALRDDWNVRLSLILSLLPHFLLCDEAHQFRL
jgi:putative lipase involved disintegration of autophagic bodies